MVLSEESVHFDIDINSLTSSQFKSGSIYWIEWERGRRLNGMTTHVVPTGGMARWDAGFSFVSTLFSETPGKYKTKILRLTLFARIPQEKSGAKKEKKKVGSVSVDLGKLYSGKRFTQDQVIDVQGDSVYQLGITISARPADAWETRGQVMLKSGAADDGTTIFGDARSLAAESLGGVRSGTDTGSLRGGRLSRRSSLMSDPFDARDSTQGHSRDPSQAGMSELEAMRGASDIDDFGAAAYMAEPSPSPPVPLPEIRQRQRDSVLLQPPPLPVQQLPHLSSGPSSARMNSSRPLLVTPPEPEIRYVDRIQERVVQDASLVAEVQSLRADLAQMQEKYNKAHSQAKQMELLLGEQRNGTLQRTRESQERILLECLVAEPAPDYYQHVPCSAAVVFHTIRQWGYLGAPRVASAAFNEQMKSLAASRGSAFLRRIIRVYAYAISRDRHDPDSLCVLLNSTIALAGLCERQCAGYHGLTDGVQIRFDSSRPLPTCATDEGEDNGDVSLEIMLATELYPSNDRFIHCPDLLSQEEIEADRNSQKNARKEIPNEKQISAFAQNLIALSASAFWSIYENLIHELRPLLTSQLLMSAAYDHTVKERVRRVDRGPVSPSTLLYIFETAHALIATHHATPAPIVNAIFTQVVRFINASLCNIFLEDGSQMCTASGALRVTAFVEDLLACFERIQLSGMGEYLSEIQQIASVLLTPKKDLLNPVRRAQICRSLNYLQLEQLVACFQPDSICPFPADEQTLMEINKLVGEHSTTLIGQACTYNTDTHEDYTCSIDAPPFSVCSSPLPRGCADVPALRFIESGQNQSN